MLAHETHGTGERLVLLHGFTQTRRAWRRLAGALFPARQVVAVDLPGHGESGHAAADLPTAAQLVSRTSGRGTYIGYSMGGRIALHVALDRPELVERLVLIGATPGIADDDERAARRAGDERLAARIEAIGVDAFLSEWLSQPLFATLPPGRADLDDRRRNTVSNLASSLRNAGTGTQEPLWDRLGSLDMPVLLVVGEHDHKFRAIAQGMAKSLPRAEITVIPDAGHSAHLEQPVATVDALIGWLDRHPPSARPSTAAAP